MNGQSIVDIDEFTLSVVPALARDLASSLGPDDPPPLSDWGIISPYLDGDLYSLEYALRAHLQSLLVDAAR